MVRAWQKRGTIISAANGEQGQRRHFANGERRDREPSEGFARLLPAAFRRVLLKSTVPQQQVLPSLGWRGCIQSNMSNSENTNRRASAFQGVLRVMQPCCCGDCGGCPPLLSLLSAPGSPLRSRCSISEKEISNEACAIDFHDDFGRLRRLNWMREQP